MHVQDSGTLSTACIHVVSNAISSVVLRLSVGIRSTCCRLQLASCDAEVVLVHGAGCAAAQAAIDGIAISDTMFKTAVQTAAQPAIGQYCVKDYTTSIEVAASGVSTASPEHNLDSIPGVMHAASCQVLNHHYMWSLCRAAAHDLFCALMLFVSHAQQASSAFAEAVANAYIDYYQFVCTCCPGNSEAKSVVSADVEVPLHLFCWTLSQGSLAADAPIYV